MSSLVYSNDQMVADARFTKKLVKRLRSAIKEKGLKFGLCDAGLYLKVEFSDKFRPFLSAPEQRIAVAQMVRRASRI